MLLYLGYSLRNTEYRMIPWSQIFKARWERLQDLSCKGGKAKQKKIGFMNGKGK